MPETQHTYTDEELVTRICSGAHEEYAEIIARYEQKMRSYGTRFLSVPHEIDDIVQDIFTSAYTNLQSFNTSMRFSPWIYRIAHNAFVNELRRKDRFGTHLFDFDTILPQLAAPEETDADILQQETEEEMQTHIARLSVKYREVIVLHYFESLSYQEISDVLHIPVTTVGVRISRARNKLKAFIQEKTV